MVSSAEPSATDASTPRQQWESAAAKALRGAPLESLVQVTLDGIEVEPLYTRDAVERSDVNGHETPGSGTRRRGATVAGTLDGWERRQTHDIGADAANAAILADLGNGITAISLSGLRDATADQIDAALEGVHVEIAPIRLSSPSPRPAADAMLEVWDRRGHPSDAVEGTLGLDPIGDLAQHGGVASTLDDALASAAALAADVATRRPHVATFDIASTVYADAGAADAQEIAAALATTVAYLRAMTDAGMSVDEAAAQIHFSMSIGPDEFAGIAKLRAARQCFARVVEASGGSDAGRAMYVHAVTASAMYTGLDPWVNMLRATTACFAAAAGGADAITVAPYDSAGPDASELGRRVARNTQSILGDESLIGGVVDPAGGSWYVESLTSDLAVRAWAMFQAIESAGGMGAALESGAVHAAIAETVAERTARVSDRRQGLVGVNEFPTLDETVPTMQLTAPPPPSPDDRPTIEPLTPRRWSEPFDRLRSAAASADEPAAFLANLDSPAVHTPRATFTQNLLAAGGVDAITNQGFAGIDECIEAFRAAGTDVAVICSSDRVYAERAASTASALKAAGCRWVVLAGAPGETADAYRAAGVDDFVHAGRNVVEALTSIHDALGVGS